MIHYRWIEHLDEDTQVSLMNIDLNECAKLRRVTRTKDDFDYTHKELKELYDKEPDKNKKHYYNMINVYKQLPDGTELKKKIYFIILLISQVEMSGANWIIELLKDI